MNSSNSKIEELERLMQIGQYLGPISEGDIFTIKCSSDFEPHGIACETWEIIWTIQFHKQQAYWVNNKNQLVKCNDGVMLSFSARTLDELLSRAIVWYKMYNEQIKGNQNAT